MKSTRQPEGSQSRAPLSIRPSAMQSSFSGPRVATSALLQSETLLQMPRSRSQAFIELSPAARATEVARGHLGERSLRGGLPRRFGRPSFPGREAEVRASMSRRRCLCAAAGSTGPRESIVIAAKSMQVCAPLGPLERGARGHTAPIYLFPAPFAGQDRMRSGDELRGPSRTTPRRNGYC